MTTLSYQFTVQLLGGPTSVVKGQAEVEAYEVMGISVPAGGSKTVELYAGDAAKRVSFLLMTAKPYSDQLSYTFGGGSEEGTESGTGTGTGTGTGSGTEGGTEGGTETETESDAVSFEGPLALVGAGAVQALGDLSGITFKNDGAVTAEVKLLIGRDPTP